MSSVEERNALWEGLAAARAAFEKAVADGDSRARDEAKLALDAAQADLKQHLADLARAPEAAAPAAPATLTGQAYPYPNYDETQAQPGGGLFPMPFVGVCLSGGGSRSASASMGALRALRATGLLEKVTFLSTVSGGGWAGVPYTFCPGAISDDNLLGPLVLDPAKLTWDNNGDPNVALNVLNGQAIGSLCTRVGILELLEQVVDLKIVHGVADDALWNRAIGKLVLEPFGLGDRLAGGVPTMYFSYTPWWLANVVLKPNPGLSAKSFYTVQMDAGRAHRPYLITNSTFFYPPAADAAKMFHGRSMTASVLADPYPFENTPMVAGIPPSFGAAGRDGRDLGGGFTDPFVFGGAAPAKPPVSQTFTIPTPASRFALSDIAGTSSSAYVDVLIQQYSSYYPWIEDLDPTYSYWPVLNAGATRNSATPYLFGDGGIVENTGIMALLRRHVPNILAFVNCSQPLQKDANGVIVVDDMLPPLFGYLPYNASNGYRPLSADPASPFRYNQVFDSAAFAALLGQLWQAFASGASAIYRQPNLIVRANPRFGIQGGDTVNVLWIYNNPVPAWSAQLSPTVAQQMKNDWWDFGNFPNYDTVTQLNLDARQVNLLAHLSSWNVASTQSVGGRPSNLSQVRSMFAG